MLVRDFIANLIDRQGESQTQISRRTGVSQGTINKIYHGDTNPEFITISKIVNGYNTALAFYPDQSGMLSILQPSVVDGAQQYTNPLKKEHAQLGGLTRIPIWGSVPAGWPTEQPGVFREEPVDYVVIKDPPLEAVGGLLVTGQSMAPDIKDGEYILYTQAYDTRSGDIVVVNDEFGKTMVKEYYEKDGEQWLRSINREYPDFRPNSQYRIMGRVIEVINRRKIRRR